MPQCSRPRVVPHHRRRRVNLRLAAGLFGLLLCTTAFDIAANAQSARVQPAAALAGVPFDITLRDWMVEHQVPAASLAAMKNGKIVATVGAGGMQATGPARIASLSKAITAVCVSRLIDEGRLSFKAPLGNLLAKQFQALGQPVDPRFKTVQWNSC